MNDNYLRISPYVFAGIRTKDLPENILMKMRKVRQIYTKDIITDAILDVTGVSYIDISSKYRDRPFCEARKMYCYFVKEKLGLSLKEIGRSIGNRDHTTVIHNISVYKDLYSTED
jgi:chromosomal replication initiator protein